MEKSNQTIDTQSTSLIGYYLSKKKLAKLHFDFFLSLCKQCSIDTIELTRDFFQREHCRLPQLIIHKFEDDETSRFLAEQIRQRSNSSTIILDEFDCIARLLDRYEQYSILNCQHQSYRVPPFIRVTNEQTNQSIEQLLKQYQISFPILCKPIQAHGDKSHDMKIIFDRCQFLSSLTFRFTSQKSIPSTKLIESFLNIKKDLTYRKDDSTIRVWLNQFNISK